MTIRELRTATGLSQAAFGKMLGGVPKSTVQSWEQGDRQPTDWTMYLIEFRVNAWMNVRKQSASMSDCINDLLASSDVVTPDLIRSTMEKYPELASDESFRCICKLFE